MVKVWVSATPNDEPHFTEPIEFKNGEDVAKWENFLIVKDADGKVIAGVDMQRVHSWEIQKHD